MARLAGRVAVPTIAAGLALWGVAVTADLAFRYAAAPHEPAFSLLASTPAAAFPTRALQTSSNKAAASDVTANKDARLASLGSGEAMTRTMSAARQDEPQAPVTAAKTARLPMDSKIAAAGAELEARFDQVVRQASLSSEKLVSIFAEKGMAVAEQSAPAKASGAGKPSVSGKGAKALLAKANAPAPARFSAHPQTAYLGTMLAYAEPSAAAESGALAALSDAIAPVPGGLAPYGVGTELPGDAALLPDYETTPDETPLPLGKPKAKPAEQAERTRDEETEKPARERTRSADADKPSRQPASPVLRSERQSEPDQPIMRSERQLAFARPDNPAEKNSGGGLLDRMFGNRPKAGKGVAVYDISAARVYMPDGTVLEAHSGIGHMADNPKYVHVKMNGPTPPHTYNLQMREKRFHGVEAIRMLPADGRNKHGRDGFLTHSYLLRGGRAESHGCVAFKDYNKFLNAFKQGKVKQLVVVPGGGRAVMTAKNGRDA
ncbi:DUF2778 domain-containing protein [Pseudaminobacter sp. 19-2017]|uniref:DUF2778 domain-containing protein n=2 Tax=Pseudaminobacter soli (ex Zhang et al. 2022) TaxID=2831468 RepID=A0A942E154_9HYPH|nr:DUF2778 domain-containing protein [Pseudaminobacter soli]